MKFTLFTKSLYFLFSRLGWFGLLVTGLLVLEDNYGGWCNMMPPSGGSNSVGGESNMGGSSRGSGWTSFDEWVLAEPFINEEGEEVVQPNPQNAPANPVASQGAAQEAMPQAPAQDADIIKTAIIQRMGELYPTDPWDPDNPLIRERLFPGGKGINNIRPMTVQELHNILDRIVRDGKKSHWAQELRRGIQNWNWKNPRGPS